MFTINQRRLLPLRVFTPSSNGTFPLIVFHHGTFLKTRIYTGILTHIASYGYVVVAPQRSDSFWDTNATRDIEDAARVIEWLLGNFAAFLPAGVSVNVGKLVNMGHSKGGKIAFALALNIKANISVPFATLVGLDPMDGTKLGQTQPRVLYDAPIVFQYPSLIIGTGLSGACSPARYNHGGFFNQTRSMVVDLIPSEYGHMDFVDDLGTFDGQRVFLLACKRKSPRKPMRDFTAGAVVAFLRAVLYNVTDAFVNIVRNPSSAPVLLQEPLVHIA
ncbi:hypothetical protein SELMODRAFT_86398 [Selaginella moellendorffii]|uniref:Uncharacterized protein n=2 Tax=Selaginella moellendorffii TaxID=88036 RepID=D8R506_SELML|nr:hypothetical protein SELMODRAFT_86398 [Selaginella moellendorffii]